MRSPDPSPVVLVIENDTILSRSLARLLEGEGFVVVLAADSKSAVAAARERNVAVAILDWHLADGGLSGPEMIRALRDAGSRRLPILVMSADWSFFSEATRAGATECMHKPFLSDVLVRWVDDHFDLPLPPLASS